MGQEPCRREYGSWLKIAGVGCIVGFLISGKVKVTNLYASPMLGTVPTTIKIKYR